MKFNDPIRGIEHQRIMSRDHRGNPLGPDDRTKQEHDPVAGLGVELACRLVGQHESRTIREGAGDGDSLLLAARQLVRSMAGPLARPTSSSRSCDSVVPLAGVRMHEPERNLDVFGGAQDRQQAEGLEDVTDAPPPDLDELALTHRGEVLAIEHDPTSRRPVETAEQVEKRGLAAARTAPDADQLPAPHRQVDSPESVDDAVARRVVAHEP